MISLLRTRAPRVVFGRRLLTASLLTLLGCLDAGGPAGPSRNDAAAVTLKVAPSLVTKGATASAKLTVPANLRLVPGSVSWLVSPDSAATVVRVAGREDSVSLTLKSSGSASIEARYMIDAGASDAVIGGAASGRVASGTGVADLRKTTFYIASFGVKKDTSAAGGAAQPSRTTIIGESRDSTIVGRDGFAGVHQATGQQCPGFDWTVQGTGVVALNAAAAGAASLRESLAANAATRTAYTPTPNIRFSTIQSGTDTIVMKHRDCSGTCSDTLIIDVLTTATALKVDATSPKILQVGVAANPAIKLALIDKNGAVTPLNGFAISMSPVTSGLTILGGGSATTGAGYAPFAALRASGLVGTYRVRFSTPTLPSVDYDITLVAGPAAGLNWKTPFPASAQAGTAITPCPVAQLIDIAGNPVAQAGVALSVKAPDGTVLGTATTDASGVATFCGITLPTGAGAVTLTVSSTSPAISSQVSVNRLVPARIVLSPATATLAIGASVALAATVYDASGVVLSTATFTWTSTNPGVATVSSSGLVSAVSLGTTTISAAAFGLTGTAAITVVRGTPDPTCSTLRVSPTTVNPGGTATVTVSLCDAAGNPILDATPSLFTAAASGGALGPFTCSNGVCTATYTAPQTSGNQTISVRLGSTNITNSPATVSVVGPASRLRISGSSSQASGSSQIITITALDVNGNIATSYTGNRTLLFSGANPLNGNAPIVNTTIFGLGTSLNFVNGVATANMTLYKAEVDTIATSDGTIGTSSLADKLIVTVFATALSTARSTVSAQATTLVVGATTTVTVTINDPNGNRVVTAQPSDFTASTSGGTLGSFTCNAGICTATYTAPTLIGSPTISVTIGGLNIGNSPLTMTIVSGPVSASQSTVVANPTSVAAGGAGSTVTVTLKDAYGNRVPGKTVTLAAGSGSSNIAPASAVSNGSGQVAFTVTDNVAQTVTYTATGNGVTIAQTATVRFDPSVSTVCTQDQSGGSSSDVNFTATLCSDRAVGDIELVTVSLQMPNTAHDATITADDGTWTLLAKANSGGGRDEIVSAIFWRRYAGGAQSGTVSFTSNVRGKWVVDMVTYRSGRSNIAPTVQTAIAANSTDLIAPNASTTVANSMVYYSLASSNPTLSITAPSAVDLLVTNQAGGSANSAFGYQQLVPAAGNAAGGTFRGSVASNMTLHVVVIAP